MPLRKLGCRRPSLQFPLRNVKIPSTSACGIIRKFQCRGAGEPAVAPPHSKMGIPPPGTANNIGVVVHLVNPQQKLFVCRPQRKILKQNGQSRGAQRSSFPAGTGAVSSGQTCLAQTARAAAAPILFELLDQAAQGKIALRCAVRGLWVRCAHARSGHRALCCGPSQSSCWCLGASGALATWGANAEHPETLYL